MKNSDWVEVGSVAVDAGIIMIGDPCYTLHKKGKEKKAIQKQIGKDWGEFVGKLNFDGDNITQIGNGTAVVVPSGYGDGYYPVSVKRDKNGRVTAVMVDFTADTSDDMVEEDYNDN